MIHTVQPLHAGNALRLFLQPPAGAVRWKVQRKGSDSFSGMDDPTALQVFDGDERVFVDSESLQNETMAFYQPWYLVGADWIAGPVANGTPVATYEEHTTDVLTKVRERLEAGLLVECQRGVFSPEIGYIQVLTAPPSMERELRLPLVTVHLESEDPQHRAIGEAISGDTFDSIGFEWNESEGWLAAVTLTIIGWCLNGDERNELRKAIRRLVVANLPVFSSLGFDLVTLSQQDIDAVNGEYPAPIYQVMSNFSCLAPVRVGGTVGAIRDVQVQQAQQGESNG